MALYLDASAIVKLVTPELESERLWSFLRSRNPRLATSALARAEVGRATGSEGRAKCRTVMAQFHERTITRPVLDRAAELDVGSRLRTLDAIHLATALDLGRNLDVLVTYDRRMADAAEALGLPVVAPA